MPVKDNDVLTLTWGVQHCENNKYEKPLSYISSLYGHEGPNSLLSYLIKLGLATGLCSHPAHELHEYSFFTVDIDLTKQGLAEYKKVVEIVF